MFQNMSFRCLLGLHKVSLTSIMPRRHGYIAICETCARPLEREPGRSWVASDPLDLPKENAA
jgi:hypothetical protein